MWRSDCKTPARKINLHPEKLKAVEVGNDLRETLDNEESVCIVIRPETDCLFANWNLISKDNERFLLVCATFLPDVVDAVDSAAASLQSYLCLSSFFQVFSS